MTISTNGLLDKMWTKSISQLRSNLIKVKCLVPTNVFIRDLNRTFRYQVEETVSAAEYHSSQELQIAIRKNLIQAFGSSEQQSFKATSTQTFNIDRELLKSVFSEVATEMVQQILKNLPVQISTQEVVAPLQYQVEKKLQAVDIEEETFVKMEADDDNNVQTNLNAQVEHTSVTTKKVLSSLAKIKEMRNK